MARINLYTISADGKAMTCHCCGFTTISARHVAERWCGHCVVYLTDIARATDMARAAGIVRESTSDRLAFLRRLLGKLRVVGRPSHLR